MKKLTHALLMLAALFSGGVTAAHA